MGSQFLLKDHQCANAVVGVLGKMSEFSQELSWVWGLLLWLCSVFHQLPVPLVLTLLWQGLCQRVSSMFLIYFQLPVFLVHQYLKGCLSMRLALPEWQTAVALYLGLASLVVGIRSFSLLFWLVLVFCFLCQDFELEIQSSCSSSPRKLSPVIYVWEESFLILFQQQETFDYTDILCPGLFLPFSQGENFYLQWI